MEITIYLLPGDDPRPIKDRYGYDVMLDREHDEYLDHDEYFMGVDTDSLEPGDEDPFDRDDCIEAIGWIEGRYPGSYCMLSGSGQWDMGEIRKTDEYKAAAADGLAARPHDGDDADETETSEG